MRATFGVRWFVAGPDRRPSTVTSFGAFCMYAGTDPSAFPLPSSAFLVTGKLDVREAAARLPEEAPLEDAAEETGLDEEEIETEASD